MEVIQICEKPTFLCGKVINDKLKALKGIEIKTFEVVSSEELSTMLTSGACKEYFLTENREGKNYYFVSAKDTIVALREANGREEILGWLLKLLDMQKEKTFVFSSSEVELQNK